MADKMAESPTPTRSLRASLHPQARMQQLLSEPPPDTFTEKNTEKNTDSHTENHTESHTPENTDLKAEALTHSLTETDAGLKAETHPDSMAETLTPTQTPRRKQVRADAKPQAQPAKGASARDRIIEDLQKEPVVRKTIDIPASLNERLQDYCAAKRIKTERRVFLVLLETFLEEEGF